MDSEQARRALVKVLQHAYSGEQAAAYAYRGHWKSVSDPAEAERIRRIEDEEWHHRDLVGGLLREVAGGQGLVVLRSGKLNQDGQNPIWPDARLASASLQWRTQWDRIFGLTLVLDHAELRIDDSDERQRDTQLRVQFELRFD